MALRVTARRARGDEHDPRGLEAEKASPRRLACVQTRCKAKWCVLDHGRADRDSLKLGFGFQVLQSLPRPWWGQHLQATPATSAAAGVPD